MAAGLHGVVTRRSRSGAGAGAGATTAAGAGAGGKRWTSRATGTGWTREELLPGGMRRIAVALAVVLLPLAAYVLPRMLRWAAASILLPPPLLSSYYSASSASSYSSPFQSAPPLPTSPPPSPSRSRMEEMQARGEESVASTCLGDDHDGGSETVRPPVSASPLSSGASTQRGSKENNNNNDDTDERRVEKRKEAKKSTQTSSKRSRKKSGGGGGRKIKGATDNVPDLATTADKSARNAVPPYVHAEETTAATRAARRRKSFEGWSCNDLVPDLCDLDVPVEGVINVKGMSVRYWRYDPPTSYHAATANDENDKENIMNDASRQNLPLVVIHGGPAQSHDYMLSLKQLACRGHSVIFYDQAGCGRSDWPTLSSSVENDYPWLLDPSYYASELSALIAALGLERYHLLGHSWGTIIATLFALDQNPGPALTSMILSGPFSDTNLYNEAQLCPDTGTLRVLPPYLRKRIKYLEESNMHGTEEYQALDGLFSVMFTSLTLGAHIIPDCVRMTYDATNWALYDKIWGPSEVRIVPSAVLHGFSTTHRLKEIDYPVLLTSSEYDLMTPKVLEPLRENLPFSEHVLFKSSAHASMVDVPGPMNNAVAEFLDRVERLGKHGVRRKGSRIVR